MKKLSSYIYLICRVDSKNFKSIEDDFKKWGYKDLKCIVPTLDILKKTKGNQNYYESVPLLFNYGFVRIKRSKSLDRIYLNKIRKEITGIHSWVKSLDTLHRKRQATRIDNMEDFDDFSRVSIISKAEINRLLKISENNKVYSNDDINNLKPGDYLTLRGYPYEGMEATLLSVDLNDHSVKVQIFPSNMATMVVTIPLDNVLYSIYYDFDDKVTAPNILPDLTGIPDEPNQESIL